MSTPALGDELGEDKRLNPLFQAARTGRTGRENRLRIESPPGEGATFTCTLPLEGP